MAHSSRSRMKGTKYKKRAQDKKKKRKKKRDRNKENLREVFLSFLPVLEVCHQYVKDTNSKPHLCLSCSDYASRICREMASAIGRASSRRSSRWTLREDKATNDPTLKKKKRAAVKQAKV